jgi:hypothetical protein
VTKGEGQRTCVNCGTELAAVSGRGRPPTACSDDCRKARVAAKAKARYQTVPRDRRNATCADCGAPCQRGRPQRGWSPGTEVRCMACYQKSRAATGSTTCQCGGPKRRESLTCRACLREAQKTHRLLHPPKNSYERGYDRRHKALRKAWQTIIELDEVLCSRCQKPILIDQLWHLDHADDRSGYLGPSHSRCNLQAGAKIRGNRLYSEKGQFRLALISKISGDQAVSQ